MPELVLYVGEVLPAWVDYNGHFSDGYYMVAFGEATDAFFAEVGLGALYRAQGTHSTYTVEGHICYLSELRLGDSFAVATRVLAADRKRLHLFHTMRHAATGTEVATAEFMFLHVAVAGPKAAPFPTPIYDRLADLAADDACLPRLLRAGRAIGMNPPAGVSSP